jgi:hypothetical protein
MLIENRPGAGTSISAFRAYRLKVPVARRRDSSRLWVNSGLSRGCEPS